MHRPPGRVIGPWIVGFSLLAAACASTAATETEAAEADAAEVTPVDSGTDAVEADRPRAEAAQPEPSTSLPPPATAPASTAPPASLASDPASAPPPGPAAPPSSPTSSPSGAPAPTSPTSPAPPTPPVPPPSTSTTASAAPQFVGSIAAIDAGTAARMTPASWREGCPVGLGELRLLRLSYWDYDGAVQTGELVVHADHAAGVLQAFEALYADGFPIQRMQLVSAYGGDDQSSMQANNTSAFNCREVAYRPGVWSNHAFGTAIDINPLVNPYVQGDFVDPEAGREFVDRTRTDVPGMIKAGDGVVSAFSAIGWIWGGTWTNALDYQHFSANGR